MGIYVCKQGVKGEENTLRGIILSSMSAAAAASGCSVTAESMTFRLYSVPAFGNCSSPGGKWGKNQQPQNSGCADREEQPRRHCRSGAQVLEGGHTQQPQPSRELLTFSRKQGGRWKGQGGAMGRGSAMGSHALSGVQKVQSSPIEKILPTRSPWINPPPSGFLLNRILLQFLWFPFTLSLSLRKKSQFLMIVRIYK